LPIAALEAMACRRPVILTRNCNLGDIETHDAGWLVQPEIDSLGDALRRACASDLERRRRGDNGRTLVADRYTWNRIAEESIRSYQLTPRVH
jgi:glycosyltransferase involved in cell wall biosynthesis